uniref:CHRD domain-containing protein n=1 Tax=Roseihalotalea indica TaxID=2867963 RepID=A0AA49GM29_9BACT|nr:hypothetical protein K4G66_22085 [Tunicatimonas sp. TK19036]
MKKIKQLLLSLLLALALFSCSKEEVEGDSITPVGFFANVDGAPFEASEEFVAAEVTLESDGEYTFGIAAFDYENINTGVGQAISIGFVGPDFDRLRPGAVFESFNVAEGTGLLYFYLTLPTAAPAHTAVIGITGELLKTAHRRP